MSNSPILKSQKPHQVQMREGSKDAQRKPVKAKVEAVVETVAPSRTVKVGSAPGTTKPAKDTSVAEMVPASIAKKPKTAVTSTPKVKVPAKATSPAKAKPAAKTSPPAPLTAKVKAPTPTRPGPKAPPKVKAQTGAKPGVKPEAKPAAKSKIKATVKIASKPPAKAKAPVALQASPSEQAALKSIAQETLSAKETGLAVDSSQEPTVTAPLPVDRTVAPAHELWEADSPVMRRINLLRTRNAMLSEQVQRLKKPA